MGDVFFKYLISLYGQRACGVGDREKMYIFVRVIIVHLVADFSYSD